MVHFGLLMITSGGSKICAYVYMRFNLFRWPDFKSSSSSHAQSITFEPSMIPSTRDKSKIRSLITPPSLYLSKFNYPQLSSISSSLYLLKIGPSTTSLSWYMVISNNQKTKNGMTDSSIMISDTIPIGKKMNCLGPN